MRPSTLRFTNEFSASRGNMSWNCSLMIRCIHPHPGDSERRRHLILRRRHVRSDASSAFYPKDIVEPCTGRVDRNWFFAVMEMALVCMYICTPWTTNPIRLCSISYISSCANVWFLGRLPTNRTDRCASFCRNKETCTTHLHLSWACIINKGLFGFAVLLTWAHLRPPVYNISVRVWYGHLYIRIYGYMYWFVLEWSIMRCTYVLTTMSLAWYAAVCTTIFYDFWNFSIEDIQETTFWENYKAQNTEFLWEKISEFRLHNYATFTNYIITFLKKLAYDRK